MHRPRRSLGQNFLIDPNLQRKIVDALEPLPSDTVLEIGPGTGALTRHLVDRVGHVIAIEKDDELADELRVQFAASPGFTLVHGDALLVDFAHVAGPADHVKVVGNIPYNITTPLIFRLLAHEWRPACLVLMVQREVAERILANPGDREYGALTVGVRTVAHVERLFHVGRSAFRPVPGVDSTVIRITPLRPPPLSHPDEEHVRALTRVAFSRRRKQLQKILRSAPEYALDPERADDVLRSLGIEPDARPETLAPDTFVALARALRADPASHQVAADGRGFVGLVSHELRSPVAAIIGYAELLNDGLYGSVDERAREALSRIASAARQLRTLIDGFEQIGGGGDPDLELSDGVDLDPLLEDAAEEARAEAALRDTSIRIAPHPRPPLLRTDPDLLARALQLILSAALREPPSAHLDIEVHLEDHSLAVHILGTSLSATPAPDPASGPELRIVMAARALTALGGSLDEVSSPRGIILRLPHAGVAQGSGD